MIAEGRALRPNDFVADAHPEAPHPTENCPFCSGHEHMTPHELAVVNDSRGQWQVRVVPNKYPAVGMTASGGRQPPAGGEVEAASTGDLRPPLACDPPHGIHEVIIESPRHVRDWTELSTDELTAVLGVFRDRIENSCTAHGMQSGLIFKNVGEAAGASLEHVHSQLIALPFVPEVLDRELVVTTEYHDQHGECLMCHLLAEELRHGTRLVVENSHFAAICAYAGRQPYETWIVPIFHQGDFTDLGDEQSHALAAIFRDVLGRLTAMLTPLAYNAVLHTAPRDRKTFHWHWEVIPRNTSLAGFEWGTGMYINPVSPERAAIRLRSSNSGEILPIQ